MEPAGVGNESYAVKLTVELNVKYKHSKLNFLRKNCACLFKVEASGVLFTWKQNFTARSFGRTFYMENPLLRSI
uniref:Uncharacterized protein n=1 Tax=Romanomermis culicivorax TaxID=13658 RepID=A0A915HIT6_ROMCU